MTLMSSSFYEDTYFLVWNHHVTWGLQFNSLKNCVWLLTALYHYTPSNTWGSSFLPTLHETDFTSQDFTSQDFTSEEKQLLSAADPAHGECFRPSWAWEGSTETAPFSHHNMAMGLLGTEIQLESHCKSGSLKEQNPGQAPRSRLTEPRLYNGGKKTVIGNADVNKNIVWSWYREEPDYWVCSHHSPRGKKDTNHQPTHPASQTPGFATVGSFSTSCTTFLLFTLKPFLANKYFCSANAWKQLSYSSFVSFCSRELGGHAKSWAATYIWWIQSKQAQYCFNKLGHHHH